MSFPRTHRALLLALVLVVIVVTLIRLRLLDVPLERDEGEYAYAGQLMLEGVAPFAQAYNMKMPGIYAAYATVLSVFGQTHQGIHLALLFINIATIFLFFLFCRRLIGVKVAVVAAASFALMSLTPAVQGMMANAEHFVLLFAIAALYLLLRSIDSRNFVLLFVSGLMFGSAFMMKQHGAFLLLFGCVLLAQALIARSSDTAKRRAATGGLFVAAAAIPFAATCLALWSAGVFERFWFWTFEYGRTYVSQVPVSAGIKLLQSRIVDLMGDSPVIWALAAAGLASPLWLRRPKALWVRVYAFFAVSFLATCPGLFFRPHYFVLFLPAVGLMAGTGAVAIVQKLPLKSEGARNAILALMVGIAAGLQLIAEAPVYFTLGPTQISRKMYGGNPFPESLTIGTHIRENSSTEDRVAVLGSEPQIYFYAKRRSATGYIYMYPLMERHEFAQSMQQEMIEQIESVQPKFIAFVGVQASWLAPRGEEPLVFRWAKEYLPANYEKVRTYPIGSERSGVELWQAVE